MASTAKTCFETEKASRYLQQLCKHFSHKVDVKFTPDAGHITLPMGSCDLDAGSGKTLNISVRAANAAALEKTKDVIEKHLERFAFREDYSLDWQG